VKLSFRTPERTSATYTLEKASKECGIGRETMRKLGVKLGMISPSGKEGHVLAFNGSAVRALADDLRTSADFAAAQAILGVHRTVLHGLVSSGLIAPLFGGREWRQQYAFRRSDLNVFIGRIVGNSPPVDAPREGLMSALDARRSFNLSGAVFLRLIAHDHVKVAVLRPKVTGPESKRRQKARYFQTRDRSLSVMAPKCDRSDTEHTELRCD
jgi:hypothetical protein